MSSPQPRIVQFMAGIVFCGVKLKNMLSEVDLTNLGLTKKIQHIFGFVDQDDFSSSTSHSLYQIQNSRNPIPIISLNPSSNIQSYSSVSHFNNAVSQFYQQVQTMSASTLIEIVAQCIQVTDNRVTINNPVIQSYQPLISFASWYLTGISPMATQVVISSVYPTLKPIFEVSILKMAQIIEPIRRSQICQLIESTFNKIGQIFMSVIPSSLLTPFLASQPEQNLDQYESQESPIPMEITSFQHVQFYLHSFSQDLRDIEKQLDLLFQSQFFLSQGLILDNLSPTNFSQLPPTHPLKQDQLNIKLKFVFQCFVDQLRHHINYSRQGAVINRQLPELINQTNSLIKQQTYQSNTINKIDQKLENLHSQLTNIKLNQSEFTNYSSQQAPDISSQLLHLQTVLTDLLEQRISSLDHTYQQFISQLQENISSTNTHLNKLDTQFQQQLSQLNTFLTDVADIQLQLSILKHHLSSLQDPIIVIQPLIDKMQLVNNSRFLTIETSIQEWYQQQMVLNETLSQSSHSQYQDLITLKQLIEANYLTIDKFHEYISSYVPPLPLDFEQRLTTFLQQQYQLDQFTLPSIQQQLLSNKQTLQVQDNNIDILQQSQQFLQSELLKSSKIIESQSTLLQQLNESLLQQQVINQQQTTQITELFNSLTSLRQSTNDNSTSIIQQSQLITQYQNQYQQSQQQLNIKLDNFDQSILSHQSTITQLLQGQDLIMKQNQQYEHQFNQISLDQQNITSNIKQVQSDILQLKNQISLIPTSPIDLSQITRLISTKLDITQFSYDYSITIQQLDANIHKLIHDTNEDKSSINFINEQLLEIDKAIQQIQNQFDIELLYNLRTQLGQVKELCTSKFKVLDYLEKYSYSNRILDFNHSTAIKSY